MTYITPHPDYIKIILEPSKDLFLKKIIIFFYILFIYYVLTHRTFQIL